MQPRPLLLRSGGSLAAVRFAFTSATSEFAGFLPISAPPSAQTHVHSLNVAMDPIRDKKSSPKSNLQQEGMEEDGNQPWCMMFVLAAGGAVEETAG
jgi:hypothetical protein